MNIQNNAQQIDQYVDTSPKVEANKLLDLGMMYSAGKNIGADRILAHKYFNLAAMSGIGEALRYRKELALEMAHDEIAEAQRQARQWLQHHVIQ